MTGTEEKGKLLAIKDLPSSSAKSQADAVLHEIHSWGLSEKVVGTAFDTTAVNSGRKNGTALMVERALKKKTLYIACRRHILELVVKAVYECDSMFGHNNTPQWEEMKVLSENWENLDLSNYKTFKKNLTANWFAAQAQETSDILHNLNSFPRDDYQELQILTLVILGRYDGVPTFRKPAAGMMKKSRFMGTIINAYKIYLFSHQMTLPDEFRRKVSRLVTFCAFIYAKYWFSCTFAPDAPVNDLRFLEDLKRFEKLDSSIAKAALQTLGRHLWYLVPQTMPFSFFSNKLDQKMKKKMALKLLEFPRQDSFPLQVPDRQFIDTSSDLPPLCDLVTQESWAFFDIFKCQGEWLNLEPDQWENNEEFVHLKKSVSHLAIINDVSERYIKTSSDFVKKFTNDPVQQSHVMQTVELNRKQYPNDKKSTLLAK